MVLWVSFVGVGDIHYIKISIYTKVITDEIK